MNLQQRFHILARLRNYMCGDAESWKNTKNKAHEMNSWFLPEFIDIAIKNICIEFLDPEKLVKWTSSYAFTNTQPNPKTIGIVMAGNIPLVGFHDFLCVFLSGHKARIKLSSKDNVLLPHLLDFMKQEAPILGEQFSMEDQLKGCDAYIATGSNNTARYFEQYFSRYPHIIRKNRTSVAILEGNESTAELDLLAQDIQLYFGLGCRNVTKLYVRPGYDFETLLQCLKQYEYFIDKHKYKNNYDYHLALLIMNNRPYKTNGSILLVEGDAASSPISVLHYAFYTDKNSVVADLSSGEGGRFSDAIQAIVGRGFLPFGKAQSPALNDYADGVDTMLFLQNL